MNFANINFCDFVNGRGVRVSLFVSGCTFNCKGCFNKECQAYDFGRELTPEVENLILKKLEDPKYKGISFLGGDPLCQDEEGLKQLTLLANKVHQLGKDVWLWSGFKYEDIQQDTSSKGFLRKVLINNCDVFIDGSFVEDLKDLSLPFRGSSNQRIIDVNLSRKFNRIVEFNLNQ